MGKKVAEESDQGDGLGRKTHPSSADFEDGRKS